MPLIPVLLCFRVSFLLGGRDVTVFSKFHVKIKNIVEKEFLKTL
jgi:hypothetical protein